MDCIMLVMGSCMTLSKSDFVVTCGLQQLCFFTVKMYIIILYKTEWIIILIIKSCIFKPL